jgi:hypothetical protein
MKLRLTYVMKGGRKIPTVNAVARFSALEEAEEFRRRLRLSGINASVVSKGAYGFEVTVPKDELEKLTPEGERSHKAVPRTRDADQRRREEKGGGGDTAPLRLRRQGSQHRRNQA